MTKMKFLQTLHEKLSHLPESDVEEHLNFYSEMIEDRMEEGFSEEEAVEAAGNIDEIAQQISAEFSSVPESNEETAGKDTDTDAANVKRHIRWWEITLIVIGAPVWLSLLISIVGVAFSLYLTLWAVIITLWAVFASASVCSVFSVLSGITFALCEKQLTGIAIVGCGFICSGFSILFFFVCRAATKGTLIFTKKAAHRTKRIFTKKEGAK